MNFFLKKKNDKNVVKEDHKKLQLELFNLIRKRFSVCVQLRLGKFKQTHILKEIRREIARVKFRLSNQ